MRPSNSLLTSLTSLGLSNILVFFLALHQNWGIQTLIAIYVIQTGIIGIFQFIKILDLKSFSTTGFSIGGEKLAPTETTKILAAFYFLFQFVIFEAAFSYYALKHGSISFWEIVVPTAIFLINHTVSFIKHRPFIHLLTPNIGAMCYMPYIRILPIAIMTTVSGIPTIDINSFFMLKTTADLIGHTIEHFTENHIPETTWSKI